MKKELSVLNFVLAFAIIILYSCKNDAVQSYSNEQKVEIAIDAFVAKLKITPPTTTDISDRVKDYMLSNPTSFYGSTVTLLDSLGIATVSPYWYRTANSLSLVDLAADSTYLIDEQSWLRAPIDSGKAIWTAPYFDAGGGNIWMKTRSVPVYVNGKIIAVATTDLAL